MRTWSACDPRGAIAPDSKSGARPVNNMKFRNTNVPVTTKLLLTNVKKHRCTLLLLMCPRTSPVTTEVLTNVMMANTLLTKTPTSTLLPVGRWPSSSVLYCTYWWYNEWYQCAVVLNTVVVIMVVIPVVIGVVVGVFVPVNIVVVVLVVILAIMSMIILMVMPVVMPVLVPVLMPVLHPSPSSHLTVLSVLLCAVCWPRVSRRVAVFLEAVPTNRPAATAQPAATVPVPSSQLPTPSSRSTFRSTSRSSSRRTS